MVYITVSSHDPADINACPHVLNILALVCLNNFVLLCVWIEVEPLEGIHLGDLSVDLLQTVLHNVEWQLIIVRLQLTMRSSAVLSTGPQIGVQSVLSTQSYEPDEGSDVALVSCDLDQ